jgi:nitrogen fixation protein FixH
MNWGTGIVIFFIVFAVSMISAVVATTKYPPQLVQKDYYALDLNYQERMDRKQKTAALEALPKASFDAASQSISVVFPEGMDVRSGTVKCFRPASAKEDVVMAFEKVQAVAVPAEKMTAGRWNVELEWENEAGEKFFWETGVNK